MSELLNAEDYRLAKRTKLIMLKKDRIGIIKKRKSRIIMKDGRQILDIAGQIRKVDAGLSIALLISGPICGKTTKFLNENQIEIIIDN